MALKKPALGRGLDSLISMDDVPARGSSAINDIDINQISPNPDQPRTTFDQDALDELATSIKELGIIQPLSLRKIGTDSYQIIAGERRYRAAKLAGLTSVPAYIRTASESELTEMALIENIQREDLNPVEEALAYKRLLEEFHLKQDELAERVSKSRTTITNSMRLLKLCDYVQQMIIDGKLTTGHARALISIENEEQQKQLAEQIFDEKLSVREVEKRVKELLNPKEQKAKKEEIPKNIQYIYEDVENKLKEKLSRKVAINAKGKNGTGKIEIEFYSNDDFDRLIEALSNVTI